MHYPDEKGYFYFHCYCCNAFKQLSFPKQLMVCKLYRINLTTASIIHWNHNQRRFSYPQIRNQYSVAMACAQWSIMVRAVNPAQYVICLRCVVLRYRLVMIFSHVLQGFKWFTRRRLIRIGIRVIILRRPSDRHRFIMGIPLHVRWHRLSE